MEKQIIVVMGASGAGKGTQARLLKKYLEEKDDRKVLYFQTGEVFRELAKKETFTAKLLDEAMDTGGLVPVFLPIWAWTSFLIENYSGEEHIIFDGLARREIEAPILDSAMEFYGIEHLKVIYLKTSPKLSRERLLERGREDDNKMEIKKRLSWFEKNTMKAIDYFREYEKGHFFEIDGERTIEEIHQDIVSKVFESRDDDN